MIIRLAECKDIHKLVPQYKEFYNTTDYAKFYPCNDSTLEKLTEHIITSGAMVVATDINDNILGSAGAWIGPATFNHDVTVAVEIVFYLDPNARGREIAPELLSALELRCKEMGAVTLQMLRLGTSPKEVDMLYKMNGYKPTEFNYTKRLVS